MRETLLLNKAWKLLLVALLLPNVNSSQDFSQIDEPGTCNEPYECSSDDSLPFKLGHQYLYNFEGNSSVKIPKNFYSGDVHHGHLATTVVVTPLSVCEITVSLLDNSQQGLKIGFDSSGAIHRVCSSQPDTTLQGFLKAVVSHLQLSHGSSQEVETTLESFHHRIEEDNHGMCLAKHVSCPGNDGKVLKYKSISSCVTPEMGKASLLRDINYKAEKFEAYISQFPQSQDDLCANTLITDLSSHLSSGSLGICIIEKNTEGLLKSATCAERRTNKLTPTIQVGHFSSSNLKLQQILEHELTSSDHINGPFLNAGMYQRNTRIRWPQSNEVEGLSTEQFISQVREALEKLTNPTDRNALSASAIQGLIERMKSQIQTRTEGDFIKLFSTPANTASTYKQEQFLLTLLAQNCENDHVQKFFHTFLSKDSLFNEITPSDLEVIIDKILDTISGIKSVTGQQLEFGRLVNQFISNSENTISSHLKLRGLIIFSQHVNQFCHRMETIRGERYCEQNALLQDWTNATILKEIGKENMPTIDKMMRLEALSNYQTHLRPTFDSIDAVGNNHPIKLWTALNYYRNEPCNQHGKQILRDILANKRTSSSNRIAAFTLIAKCFDKEDQKLIAELTTNVAPENYEILTFIKGYNANRDVYGVKESTMSIPEENSVGNYNPNGDQTAPPENTRASNTFLLFNLPGLPHEKLTLETNMLYFEKPAVIPELITLTVATFTQTGGVLSNRKSIFEVQIFTVHPDEEAMHFAAIIVVRKLGRTVYLKNISTNHGDLLKLLPRFNVHNLFNPVILLGPLHEFIMNEVTVNGFEIFPLLEGSIHIPTLSGLSNIMKWEADGIMRFHLNKSDCADVFRSRRNPTGDTCQLFIQPELTLNGKLSFGSEDPVLNQQRGHFILANLSLHFPSTINLLRKEDGTIITKLTFPSFSSSLVEGDAELYDMTVQTDPNKSVLRSLQRWSFAGSLKDMKCHRLANNEARSESKMEITFTTQQEMSSRKSFAVKIADENFEGNLEVGSDPLYYIQGNITRASAQASNNIFYAFHAGVKAEDDDKRLHAKFIMGEEEYSMNTFYIRDMKNSDANPNRYGFFSCSNNFGRGVLCRWPFCFFCGTEYHIGAIVTTPKFKDMTIFEATVTQVFPDQRIDILIHTTGLPIISSSKFKFSLSRGNDTFLYHNSRLKEGVNQHVGHILKSPQGSGDALPEAEALARMNYTMKAYLLETEISSEKLGRVELSLTLLDLRKRPGYRETTLFGGELLYPWQDRDENLSFLTVFTYGEEESGIASDYITKGSLRSTQFPLVNTDLSARTQRMENSTAERLRLVVKPLNLILGEIKVDMLDHTGKFYRDLMKSSWYNVHVNTTFKVYLPLPFHINLLKGKVAIKRESGILEEARLEMLVGLDYALELQYDFFQEGNNGRKILTSVTMDGETYGLYHLIEPVSESDEVVGESDAENVLDDEDNQLQRQKYKGTYVLGDKSFKAVGLFLDRKGREILPFSKFDIRISTYEGQDLGIRLFGHETVQQETIHNMKIALHEGDVSIFEFINEIDPTAQTPVKAMVHLKDHGEIRISDNSKFKNVRNLKVKARWSAAKRVVHGKISFPASLEEPLYLDLDVGVADEAHQDLSLFKATSSSVLEFSNSFSFTTENVIHLRDSKWEFGLESGYMNDHSSNYDENEGMYKFQVLSNTTFGVQLALPNTSRYALGFGSLDLYENGIQLIKHHLKAERPNVTPFQLVFNMELQDRPNRRGSPENSTEIVNKEIFMKVCHQDNFLYVLPMLDANFTVRSQLEIIVTNLRPKEDHYEINTHGKVFCRADGISLPVCNNINITYNLDSAYDNEINRGPWKLNILGTNNQPKFVDEFSANIVTTYDLLRPLSYDGIGDDFGLINEFLRTTWSRNLTKLRHNMDYYLTRTVPTTNSEGDNRIGVNGTYVLTKMFESWNFFEFSDEHRWSELSEGKLHIWTNLLNHSTDSNLTSESATFSSHYVSLLKEVDENRQDITWMELRTTLISNGLGTIQGILLQPQSLLESDGGNAEFDFLIRTEFSPVKTLRLLMSHDHSKSENEDDESCKYSGLTKLNGVMNDVEISSVNSATVTFGKLIGIGNIFMGNYNCGADGTYRNLTANIFAISPPSFNMQDSDSLGHVDASISWTNADEEDTDLKIVGDCVKTANPRDGSLMRLAYFANSTDSDMERNGSLVLYKNADGDKDGQLRLAQSFISESLDDLSFSQVSLQSVSQQVLEELQNSTGNRIWKSQEVAGDNSESGQYIIEVRSTFDEGERSSDFHTRASLNKHFHCYASQEVCLDGDRNNSTVHLLDVSNYCNGILLVGGNFVFEY